MKRPPSQFAKFVDSHFGPPLNIKHLYHYTSVEALFGILQENPVEGEEICLRATHWRYLNDIREVTLGVHLLFKYLYNERKAIRHDMAMTHEEYAKCTKEFGTQWERRFVISFSTKKDSLPMWNMYADSGKGIVLEFKKFASISDKDLVLRSVYAAKKIRQILKSDNNDKKTVVKMHTPLFLKHQAYSYEKEVRLIGIFEENEVKYRHKKGVLVPYVECKFPKEILESITIGPAANQEELEISLRKFLDSRGFPEVKIKRSKIPYRDF